MLQHISYYKSFHVYLTDDDGVPLIGEKISIMINGTAYCREVTPKGYAAFAILLQPGEYDAVYPMMEFLVKPRQLLKL